MNCTRCGKKFLGSGLTLKLEGEPKAFCADCFWEIRKEYDKKKKCEDCAYFQEEPSLCRKTELELVPTSIGVNDYFIQAEKCVHYSTREEYDEKALRDEIVSHPRIGVIGRPDILSQGGEIEKNRQKTDLKVIQYTCEYCDHKWIERPLTMDQKIEGFGDALTHAGQEMTRWLYPWTPIPEKKKKRTCPKCGSDVITSRLVDFRPKTTRTS